jgi:hypothetical protein
MSRVLALFSKEMFLILEEWRGGAVMTTWRWIMKLGHAGLVLAISLAGTGVSLAQTNNAVTQTNTVTATGTAGGGFNSSFSMSTGNMRISQSGTNTANSGAFCQFFSFTFGFTRIVQIIDGAMFGQSLGSSADPEIADPCL